MEAWVLYCLYFCLSIIALVISAWRERSHPWRGVFTMIAVIGMCAAFKMIWDISFMAMGH
jgi:hypothetical protein